MKIIPFKSRCKHCGHFPSYLSFIDPAYITSGVLLNYLNKFKIDLDGLHQYDEVYLKNIMRRYSIRGTTTVSSHFYKMKKNNEPEIVRFLISCKCGIFNWIFSDLEIDDSVKHRKIKIEYKTHHKYDYKPYVLPINTNIGK